MAVCTESTMATVAALKNTEKGRLKYTPDQDPKTTKDFLDSLSPLHYAAQSLRDVTAPIISDLSSKTKNINGFKTQMEANKSLPKTNGNVTDVSVNRSTGSDCDSNVTSPRLFLTVEKEICTIRQSVDATVEEKVLMKKAEFERNDQRLVTQSKKQADIVNLRISNTEAINLRRIQNVEEQQREDARAKQYRLEEFHRHHAKEQVDRLEKVDQEMRFQENERRRCMEEQRRQRALSEIVPLQSDVETSSAQLAAELASCQYPNHLTANVSECMQLMHRIKNKLNDIYDRALRGDAVDASLNVARDLMLEARKIVDTVSTHVAEANRRGDEEKAAAAQKQKQADQRAAAQALAPTPAVSLPSTSAASGSSTNSSLLLNSPAALVDRYNSLKKLLEQTAAACETFQKDPSCSKDRFDLQKAVNTPVNAISPTTGAHLLDKLHRLLGLLAGQNVEIGGRHITARKHNIGIQFCKDLLAKKIVKQGDEQVSSNHDSAFAIASVAVGVWCEHPDVGELLLANFYTKCPYLLPYYIPHDEGQTSRQEYYKSLGYNICDGGEVEQQDKFLRRMSGLTCLYAAVIVSAPPPRGSANRSHPHGIEHAWLWLSNVVNISPRPDVTATVLNDFLAVVGHSLHRTYGQQFIKLVRLLAGEYMQRVVAVTPAGASGPVMRLEATLKVAVAGRLSPPKGLIQSSFWSTS